MPKETITDPSKSYLQNGYVTDPPLDSESAKNYLEVASPRLEVNWMKPSDIGNGFVQVSMQLDRNHVIELGDRLKADSAIVASWVYTEALTRAQINDAIRILRRARDQAHGVDE